MVKEERLNKALYKLLIILLKTLPFIIAAIYILDLVLQFFDIDFVILSYIATVTVIPWLFMYLASWVFKFCIVHRLPLYYILVEDLMVVLDNYLHFPLSALVTYEIHFVLIGIFIFALLYYHQKQRKHVRSNKRTIIENSRRYRCW